MKDSRVVLNAVNCDLCGANPEIIFDAPTRGGQWGYMCKRCLVVHGVGLKSLGSKHHNRPRPEVKQELDFPAWMHATDQIFSLKVGLGIDDILGDWNSRDMFDDGMSPTAAAAELQENVRSEYGVDSI